MKEKRWAISLIIFILLITGMFIFYKSWRIAVQAQEVAIYVGKERCRPCHPAQMELFHARDFAKSWRAIEMRRETANPECLKCHVTGFGKPGGFVSVAATPHLRYKQCEACHGPGSLHVRSPGDKEAIEGMRTYLRRRDNCTVCHYDIVTHRIIGF